MAMSTAPYYGSVLPHDPFYIGGHHQPHHFQQQPSSRHLSASADGIKFDLAGYGNVTSGVNGSNASNFEATRSPTSAVSAYGVSPDSYSQVGHHVVGGGGPGSGGAGLPGHLMSGGGGAAAAGFGRFSSQFDAAVRSLHCKSEGSGPTSVGSGYLHEPAVAAGAPAQQHIGGYGLQAPYHQQTAAQIGGHRFAEVEDRMCKQLSATSMDPVGQSMVGGPMGLVAGHYGMMSSSSSAAAAGQGFNPSTAATAAAAMMAAAAMQASMGAGGHHQMSAGGGVGPCAGSAAGLPIYPWMRSMAAGQ